MQPAFSFPTADKPGEGEKVASDDTGRAGEEQLDEAIAQSFPASDPVSVTVSPVPKESPPEQREPASDVGAASSSPAKLDFGFWAAAFISTAALGLGAAWLLRRRTPAVWVASRVLSRVRKPLQRAARSVHLPGAPWR